MGDTHMSDPTTFDVDEDGWNRACCTCGWTSPPLPGIETAVDVLMQHAQGAAVDAALSGLAEGIEIVEGHRSGCEGGWIPEDEPEYPQDEVRLFCWGERFCAAQARISEALLVSLVEAREEADG